MENYTFIVTDDYAEIRADKFLAELMPDKSRSYIQKLIKEGHALINNSCIKASTKVDAGDKIILNVPELTIPEILPENIPLNIAYEDDDFMIINKPKDMVVHPAPGHYSGTVVNAVMYHTKDLSGINGVLRPGIVHRIDKNTTGLIVICKNDKSHNDIALQLKNHDTNRRYHCIVVGNIKEDEGTIDKPIGRSINDRKKMSINPTGKNAITHFKVLERFGNYTYIECMLETGRTHQIRVHMSSINHAILGDDVYGTKSQQYKTNGQVLHAKTLGFIHPSTKEPVLFDSELPEYFSKILDDLRSKH